jgi:hypothetical protein
MSKTDHEDRIEYELETEDVEVHVTLFKEIPLRYTSTIKFKSHATTWQEYEAIVDEELEV